MPVSATPNPATWRSERLQRYCVCGKRGPRGPHELAHAVDQAGPVEPCEAVHCPVVVAQLAGDLVHRPRTLRVLVAPRLRRRGKVARGRHCR